MNIQVLTLIGLRGHLWLRRFNWSKCLVALLTIISGIIWLWVVPQLDRQAKAVKIAFDVAQKKLESTTLAAPVLIRLPDEEALRRFYEILGDSNYVEQQLKTVFALAAENGLNLSQAEYKFNSNNEGSFNTYTISLPVKGQYGAIRNFFEQVLLIIPFAALNEVEFKRDSVGNSILDVKLCFTLYLSNTRGNATSGFERAGDEL